MKMTTTENIRKRITNISRFQISEFHSSLLPGKQHSRRTHPPTADNGQKSIKKEDWRTFVGSTDTIYYEETMLQGMIIGLAKNGT